MAKQEGTLDAIGDAFPGMMDLRMSKFIPLGHIDITLFEITFRFMVGPIPLCLC